MTLLTAAMALLSLTVWSVGQAATPTSEARPTLEDVRTVAPALEQYTQGPLGDAWKRPGLGPRDRSIVTVAALVARHQTVELAFHVNLALDHGVRPSAMSEIITHRAFYSSWANAMSAVAVAKDVC